MARYIYQVLSYILCVIVIVMISQCEKSTLTENDVLYELRINKQKWVDRNSGSYEFDESINCFCLVGSGNPYHIVVSDNKIVSVKNNKGEAVEIGPEHKTISQFFDSVESSLKRNPATKTIIYDEVNGFPKEAYFDYSLQMADEENGFEIENFVKK